MARVEEGHKAAEKGDAMEKDPKAAGDAAAPITTPGPNGRVCCISRSPALLKAAGPVTVACLCACVYQQSALRDWLTLPGLCCVFCMCSWLHAAPISADCCTLSE